jgi:hypothetical protein
MMITPSSVFYLSSRSFDSVNTTAVFLQSSYPEQLARAGVSTGSENTLQVDSTYLGSGLQIDSSSLKKIRGDNCLDLEWWSRAVVSRLRYKKATRQQGDLLFKGE